MQNFPFNELILFAYAADRTPRPTYVCLPSGLHHARTGRILPQTGLPKKSHHCQAFTPLMGGECSQHWTSQSTCQAPRRHQHTAVEQPRIPLGARNQPDLLRRRHGTYLPLWPAAKNQPEDGSGTRRAAIRACKYLRVMVSQHGPQLQAVYDAAKVHTQRSKGSATNETTPYRLKESELPVVEDDLLAKCMMFPSFHRVLVFLELVLIVKGVIFIICLQYLCVQFTG